MGPTGVGRGLIILVVLGLMVSACTSSAPTAPPAPAPGSEPRTSAEAPRARKVVTIAIQREPSSFQTGVTGAASPTAGGASNVEHLTHDKLAVETAIGQFEPQLAVARPSLEQGTWKLNPDGTMDTVWRLRPNIKWHDGTPMAAEDLVFSFTVLKDPELPKPRAAAIQLMQSVTVIDPATVSIKWSDNYVLADQEALNEIVPRHLLESRYLNDKLSLPTAPHFTTEFIGLGPYRLVKWEPGAYIEFSPFEHYYRGRPPLDSVVVRFIGDPNTMVANVLAGSVDVVLPTGVDVEAALEVKQRWQGTGHQVMMDPTGRLRQLELQFRPEFSRPRNGLTNRPVRQALFQAIDRATMVTVMTDGLAPAADSWYPPNHGLRKELEPGIPPFPFDPSRAPALLAEAGWARGGDGVLVHQPSGERFEVELWADQGRGSDKEQNIIADGWKSLGVTPILFTIPAARLGEREFEAAHPGPMLTNPSGDAFYENRLHSRDVSGPANRWSGRNRGGYANPRVDAVLDLLQTTIDPRQRVDLHRQLLQEQMGDIAVMPLYWEVVPILALKGIKGPRVVRNEATQNFYLWDRE